MELDAGAVSLPYSFLGRTPGKCHRLVPQSPRLWLLALGDRRQYPDAEPAISGALRSSGCKYWLVGDNPAQRIVLRGIIFGFLSVIILVVCILYDGGVRATL